MSYIISSSESSKNFLNFCKKGSITSRGFADVPASCAARKKSALQRSVIPGLEKMLANEIITPDDLIDARNLMISINDDYNEPIYNE